MPLDQMIQIIVIILILLLVVGGIFWLLWNLGQGSQSQTKPSSPARTPQKSSIEVSSATSTAKGLQNGIQHLNRQEYDSAIAEFTSYILTNTFSPLPYLDLAYLYRARAYQSINQLDLALADYDNAVRQNPDVIQSYTRRADFKRTYMKDYQGALDDIELALKRDPNEMNSYLMRGLIRADLRQDEDEVIKDFDQAFRLAPPANHAPIYVQRAQAHYGMHNLTAALKDLREAIHLGSSQTEYCLSMMARIFSEKRDFRQALAIHDERIRRKPQNPSYYAARGLAHHQSGDLNGAFTDYKKAISLDPQHAEAYNYRAWAYAAQGDYPAALMDCEKLISLNTNSEYGIGTRGTVYLLQGRYDEALRDFDRVITINANQKLAVLGQALTFHQMGKLVEAQDRWNALLKMDPSYATADEFRDEVSAPPIYVDMILRLISQFGPSQGE